MKATAFTEAGYHGWHAVYFDLQGIDEVPAADSIRIEVREKRKAPYTLKAEKTEKIPGGIRIRPDYFQYLHDFTVSGPGFSFSKEDVGFSVDGDELFERLQQDDVLYRLYSPKASGKRPLILFLHGGGECGWDNFKQLVGTPGAVLLARRYPDFYVMAPQAPGDLEKMLPGDPSKTIFQNTFAGTSQADGVGWYRGYLAEVCDIIRGMIADGHVDADRVYVIGMSMGGAGTLRALSVGAGLFAAAVPICPTMMPETFAILKSVTPDVGIWVATAYVDHTIYRHKYIVDGILALKDSGHPNAHLTIYSPEEMEAYGYSRDPGMSLQEKLLDNHNSWTPTLHGEHGILEWMVTQHR